MAASCIKRRGSQSAAALPPAGWLVLPLPQPGLGTSSTQQVRSGEVTASVMEVRLPPDPGLDGPFHAYEFRRQVSLPCRCRFFDPANRYGLQVVPASAPRS